MRSVPVLALLLGAFAVTLPAGAVIAHLMRRPGARNCDVLTVRGHLMDAVLAQHLRTCDHDVAALLAWCDTSLRAGHPEATPPHPLPLNTPGARRSHYGQAVLEISWGQAEQLCPRRLRSVSPPPRASGHPDPGAATPPDTPTGTPETGATPPRGSQRAAHTGVGT